MTTLNKNVAHRNVLDLEYVRRHVARTEALTYRLAYACLEILIARFSGSHLDEEQHAFVLVCRPALADAQRVVDLLPERLKHRVDLGRAKPYARGVQHTVTTIQHGLSNLVLCGE